MNEHFGCLISKPSTAIAFSWCFALMTGKIAAQFVIFSSQLMYAVNFCWMQWQQISLHMLNYKYAHPHFADFSQNWLYDTHNKLILWT